MTNEGEITMYIAIAPPLAFEEPGNEFCTMKKVNQLIQSHASMPMTPTQSKE